MGSSEEVEGEIMDSPKRDERGYIVMDLAAVLQACERAQKVVDSWPQWKRDCAKGYTDLSRPMAGDQ